MCGRLELGREEEEEEEEDGWAICAKASCRGKQWVRLCRLRLKLRSKDFGHWSHLNGRSFC
jgi:hypothetical protein